MKTEYRNIPFTIVMQGAPVITDLNAVVFVESDNIMCLDVDLDSKWCELVGTGGGDGGIEVYVDGTGRTYHPRERTRRSRHDRYTLRATRLEHVLC
jgi:hypothetical protein